MIISPSQRLLFIHIPRTGGASISNVLRQCLPDARAYLGMHATAREARDQMGSEFESYYRFAFVRHPWDRLLSWYALLQRGQSMGGKEPTESLSDFLDRIASNLEVFPDQVHFLTDEDGQMLVSEVGRTESLAADLGRMLASRGVECRDVPRVNTTDAREIGPSDASPERLRARALFQRDLEAFGYAIQAD